MLMEGFVKILSKTRLFLLLLPLFFGGVYFVFAQFSGDVYTVRTVHIFPAEIETEGFNNVETLNFQNLDEYALLQDFNKINSATLDEGYKQVIEDPDIEDTAVVDSVSETPSAELSDLQEVDDNTSIEPTVENEAPGFAPASDSVGVEQAPNLVDTPTSVVTTTPSVADEVIDEVISESETADDNVQNEPTPVEEQDSSSDDSETGTTTVLKRAASLFALAVESATEFFAATGSQSESVEVADELVLPSDVATDTGASDQGILSDNNGEAVEDVVFGFPTSSPTTNATATTVPAVDLATSVDAVNSESASDVVGTFLNESSEQSGLDAIDEMSTEPVDVIADDYIPAPVQTTTVSGQDQSSDSETPADLVDTPPAATELLEPCTKNCQQYSITLKNFGFPLEERVDVTGAQLRLSLAAKQRETRDLIPSLSVYYSLDGEVWTEGGIIIIDDEVSNSLNGGYFLFALPEVADQTSLDALQVQIRYENDPMLLKELYIESLWLELFTLEAPEIDEADKFLALLENDGYDDEVLSGDTLVTPDDEEITFNFTDQNDGESLIIKTDKKTYEGLSEVTTYFSVTNTSNKADDINIQTYFSNGLGEVESIELYNQNKPRQAIIPEYRPYVYHCEDGWEYAGEYTSGSLDELSRQLSEQVVGGGVENTTANVSEEAGGAVSTTSASEATSTDSGADIELSAENVATEESVEFAVPTTTDIILDETFTVPPTSTDTTTVSLLLPGVSQLLQASATSSLSNLLTDVASTSVATTTLTTSTAVAGYMCRNTNIIRECDELDGANTACRVDRVMVTEHEVTRYAPGWDVVDAQLGALPEPGFVDKALAFIGFGPDRKEVPDGFSVRTHTQEGYTIEPGETLYFKMDITFPAFSTGEYWIEAIGEREYGLLDPFWSSGWQYRLPVRIDNTTGSAQSEYQVLLQLDSNLSDFWSNVQSDGSDIRFVQEVTRGNLFAENGPVYENAYSPQWTGRIALNIPGASVDENLTDFPVHVDLSTLGPDFWSTVREDGGDIRVTETDGQTEVPTELVWMSTTTKSGELYFRATAIDDVDGATFHIYYGNPAATAYASSDTYGSQNVWTNGYRAVYHFQNEGLPGINNPGVYKDSTANGFDAEDDTFATGTTGYLGEGIEFLRSNGTSTGQDGSDHINIPYQAIDGEPEATFSVWYQTTNTTLAHTLLSAETALQANAWIAWLNTGNSMQQYTNGAAQTAANFSPADAEDGVWSQYVFTRSGDNNADEARHYVDGQFIAADTNITGATIDADPDGLVIGMEQDGADTTTGLTQSLDGFVDGARLANTVRSDAWIAAEYESMSDPTNFYSTSTASIEATNFIGWYDTSWNQRMLLTIPANKAQSDLSEFPVYVDLSVLGDTFFSYVANDGGDIRVTTSNGRTELPIELVGIDAGAKTGQMYFKADLVGGADNEFYIYYENPDAELYDRDDTYGAENVWTNGYRAVYHFEESVSGVGTTNAFKDSTSNEFHADDETASNGKIGYLGKGQQLGVDQNDYIRLPHQVLDGIATTSVSWWHRSSTTGDQSILSGANAAQANELWVRLDNNNLVRYHYQGPQEVFDVNEVYGTYNNDTWQHYTVMGEASTNLIYGYMGGEADENSPQPGTTVGTLSIDPNGLIVGQDQDSVGAGFQNTENFEGFIDELRISNVMRTSDWVAIEHDNMADPTSFFATSTPDAITNTEFVELDFWLQHFDSTSEEADVWVQIEDFPAEQTEIWIYYGNTGASSASDEFATFSYSTTTDIYYVVDDHGGASVEVQSLVDNNLVAIDGGTPVSLNRGESTSFSTFDGESVISVLGPISGTVIGSGNDAGDTIVPIGFASTDFTIPTNRDNDSWYVFSPFASSSVSMYIANAGSPNQTQSIATGTVATFTTNPADTNEGVNGDGVVVEATAPVLVTHRSSAPNDGLAAYPATTLDLYGVYSQYVHYSALSDNTSLEVTCSTGVSSSTSGLGRGDKEIYGICSSGDQADGRGYAVRVSGQDSPVGVLQQADGDGNESTVFWPQHEFGTRYAMTGASAYAAIVCAPRFGTTTLEIQDNSGSTISSGSCVPTATAPGKTWFNNGNGTDGGAPNYPAGYQVVSTNGVPFYVIFEDVTVENDEKNILGAVQARKYDGNGDRQYLYGEQEVANDAVYEQRSFSWYQNIDDVTPTDAWDSGGEPVAEGEAISGAGSIENGDELRLRMNLAASNATGTVGSGAFRLQYGQAAEAGQCTAIDQWYDVGDSSSTTIFIGNENDGVSDGRTLPSTLLTDSTVAGTYEERNLSNFLPNQVDPGEVVEFDWAIEAYDVAVNSTYCFRMVRSSGETLASYTLYPELQTVGPPETPTSYLFFDNEKTNSLTPVLEFSTTDDSGDDIHYRVQIASSSAFDASSILVDETSEPPSTLFKAVGSSDKAPFSSGRLVRFTGASALSPTTTYWYRVSATDPLGSATSSDWSTPFSFTTDTVITVSEWYQTTGEQFSTNELTNISTTSVSADLSASPATVISTPIDFDDATVGNAWGEVDWNSTEVSGTTTVQVQYNDNGSWKVVPNTDLPGNAVGFTSGPVSILELDTSTYNVIRLQATLEGTTVSLDDWSVRWGLRVDIPTQGDLFDNEKQSSQTPVFDFYSTDPQGDDLIYEIEFSTAYDFSLATTSYVSSTSAQFTNITSGGGSPFNSGDTITFTTPAGSPFTTGTTYWWRTRAKDPLGGNAWSPWAEPDAFTVVAAGSDTWSSRVPITIASTSVAETLTDFPVYVDLSTLGPDFFSEVRADGGDIRVTTADGATEVPREVVAVNTGAGTGELHFKAPTLSSTTDNTFYIYYGNATAEDYPVYHVNGANNVWTNGYVFVSHDGAGTDSTSNDVQSTAFGTISLGGATGQLGSATQFNGSNARLSLDYSYNRTDDLNNLTAQAWVRVPAAGGDWAILDFDRSEYFTFAVGVPAPNTTNGEGPRLGFFTTDSSGQDDMWSTDATIRSDTWRYVAMTFDSLATNDKKIYLDGSLESQTDGHTAGLGGTDLRYGVVGDGSESDEYASADNADYNNYYYEGYIDELRYSEVTRSTNWIATEYTNQYTPASFYATSTDGGSNFTLGAGTAASTWFQTTQAQFEQGTLDGVVATSSGGVVLTDEIGEFGTVTLTDNDWTTISTQREYVNMVVVASAEYAFNGTTNGRTVRIRNKTADSFEIKADDASGSFTGSTVADYIVVEAGDWVLDNGGTGVRLLAATERDVTEKKVNSYANGSTRIINYSTFGTTPAVFAAVTSDNDSEWVGVHVDDGVGYANSITNSQLGVALAVSKDTGNLHSGPEDIDYIVVEPTTGTNNGTVFQIGNSPDGPNGNAGGVGVPISGFTSTPAVTVLLNNGDDGLEGGFAQKDTAGTNNATTLSASIAELPVADGHADNVVSFAAFETSSGILTRVNDGNLSGTITGEEIIFSDGSGPKFDNFSWVADTPGGSSILMRLEYESAPGTFSLLPDGVLAGNSSGFISMPIDLSGIDVNTYPVIRPFATLQCASGVCPELQEWELEWRTGVSMSGTLREYDRLTAVATGTIKAAVNGVETGETAEVSAGTWTMGNVTAFAGDIVTVWVDGATEAEEAVTAFIYDGSGDITGVKLYEQHLSFVSDDTGTISNYLLGITDSTALSDEDVFFEVSLGNDLSVCGVGTCPNANLYVGPTMTYIPATSTSETISTHDFINDGTIDLNTNTFNVSGSWINYATSSVDTSTINLTAASGAETITSTESPLQFHDLSFGSGVGNATFTIATALDLSGDLTVASGTLDRGTYALTVGGSVTTGPAGYWVGVGTTTFDGSGAHSWVDNNAVPQNLGAVIIDGVSAAITVAGDVAAYDITIGANDTLNAGAATIYLGGDFSNNGTFTGVSSHLIIVPDDRTYPDPTPGTQGWYADTDFTERLTIEIDPAEVLADLTSFPVYVDLSTLGADFWSGVASDGRDIRVTEDDGQTELPHELVEIDSVAKTGELHFLAPSVASGTTTVFYLYFNNPTATAYLPNAPFGAQAVWQEYAAVYHFSEDPAGGITDVSGNGKNLVVDTGNPATTTGHLGTAIDFTIDNIRLTDADWSWVSGEDLYSSGWYYQTAFDVGALWQWGTACNNNAANCLAYMPWYNTATLGYNRFGNMGGSDFNFTRNATRWHHFTTNGRAPTGSTTEIYEDSILRDTVTQDAADANPSNTGLQIGRYLTNNYWDAYLDELRFATTTRTSDWIAAEYTNQWSPTNFYSTTSVETYVPSEIIDEATHNIDPGGAAFFDFTVDDATTSVAFLESSVVVVGDFTIATGTLALPTGCFRSVDHSSITATLCTIMVRSTSPVAAVRLSR
jgi:hypothetical protein